MKQKTIKSSHTNTNSYLLHYKVELLYYPLKLSNSIMSFILAACNKEKRAITVQITLRATVELFTNRLYGTHFYFSCTFFCCRCCSKDLKSQQYTRKSIKHDDEI